MPQDVLLELVWGRAYAGEGHLLQVNINRLRHKLEPDPTHPRYILTKAGVGYLLATPRNSPDGIQMEQRQSDADIPRGADENLLQHSYV